MDVVTKVLLALLNIVANLIAVGASLAGWYQRCLPVEVSKGVAYLVVFLPLIAGLLVLLFLNYGLLPWAWTDEVMSAAGLVSSLCLYASLYMHFSGKCRTGVCNVKSA